MDGSGTILPRAGRPGNGSVTFSHGWSRGTEPFERWSLKLQNPTTHSPGPCGPVRHRKLNFRDQFHVGLKTEQLWSLGVSDRLGHQLVQTLHAFLDPDLRKGRGIGGERGTVTLSSFRSCLSSWLAGNRCCASAEIDQFIYRKLLVIPQFLPGPPMVILFHSPDQPPFRKGHDEVNLVRKNQIAGELFP